MGFWHWVKSVSYEATMKAFQELRIVDNLGICFWPNQACTPIWSLYSNISSACGLCWGLGALIAHCWATAKNSSSLSTKLFLVFTCWFLVHCSCVCVKELDRMTCTQGPFILKVLHKLDSSQKPRRLLMITQFVIEFLPKCLSTQFSHWR